VGAVIAVTAAVGLLLFWNFIPKNQVPKPTFEVHTGLFYHTQDIQGYNIIFQSVYLQVSCSCLKH
jgi:hypothetical protein